MTNSRNISNAETPLVTIGLPFSQEKTADFLLAVKSIFCQTYTNWELILVADNAKIDLVRLAENLADPRVTVINDGRCLGLSERLNQISDIANGRYVARMDSDDIMHPRRIEVSVTTLIENVTKKVASTGAYQIDEKSSIKGDFHTSSFGTNRDVAFRSSPIIHPTVIFERDWCRANRYDPSFSKAQDKELWIRALRPETYIKIEENLLFYRVGSSLTYSKHRATNIHDRRIIRNHGPAQIGLTRSAILLARSVAKEAIFFALSQLGRTEFIYKRKYLNISPVERALACDQLDMISESRLEMKE